MIVVSDTTPLISLLKIDKVYLLEKLFGRIFIPQAVFNELVIDKRFIEEADIIRNNSQIEVKEVGSLEAVDILRRVTGLDIDVKECIEQLKKSGRHIGYRYYNMLLSMIDSRL